MEDFEGGHNFRRHNPLTEIEAHLLATDCATEHLKRQPAERQYDLHGLHAFIHSSLGEMGISATNLQAIVDNAITHAA